MPSADRYAIDKVFYLDTDTGSVVAMFVVTTEGTVVIAEFGSYEEAEKYVRKRLLAKSKK